MFELFDRSGSGSVDYVELCLGLVSACGGSRVAKARMVFALMDPDNTGVITKDAAQWCVGVGVGWGAGGGGASEQQCGRGVRVPHHRWLRACVAVGLLVCSPAHGSTGS